MRLDTQETPRVRGSPGTEDGRSAEAAASDANHRRAAGTGTGDLGAAPLNTL